MTPCIRHGILAGAFLATTLFATSSLWAATIPQAACELMTTADYKALGVSGAPQGRIANSPNQVMSTCTAGSLKEPPMLSLMIQDIKMPIAVEMGRKSLATEKGDDVTGPWDTGKAISRTDGTQFHFFKGNVSVLVMTTVTTANARTTLIEIGKRVAKAL